jgi:aminopeptidase N
MSIFSTRVSRRYLFLLAAGAGVGSLAGCKQGEPPPPVETPACVNKTGDGRKDASAFGTPQTGPRPYDVQDYALRGAFDWEQKVLRATVDITVRITDPASTTLQFDSRVAQVSSVTAEEGTPLPFQQEGPTGLLSIDLSPLGGCEEQHTLHITYEARTSSSMTVAMPRDQDPVTARVVYTNSEPMGGMLWMPGNHRPDDRASFSVELTMPLGEDMVSNGDRVKETTSGDTRTIRYSMSEPVPTYVMAFAQGELEHVQGASAQHVPLSLWYRRGLLLDVRTHLEELTRAMDTFERLLGPYPFKQYSVVLLPDFPGGMENATITFNSEFYSQGVNVLSFNLNAHELAHQWFGDYVTVKTWDDLWIKEGLAVMLAVEAERARLDQESRNRLMGGSFIFNPDDAIRDVALGSSDNIYARYTSGPYERSAWLMTQLRARVGEGQFWQTLRKILNTHALGAIDTNEFVSAFAPLLDSATLEQFTRAIDAKGIPRVSVQKETRPEGTELVWSVNDPNGLLLAPLEVSVIQGQGQAETFKLTHGSPLRTWIANDAYLALDERDVHPDWSVQFGLEPETYQSSVTPRFLPHTPTTLQVLTHRSAVHQERALATGLPSGLRPEEFPLFVSSLDSHWARVNALASGCDTFNTPGLDPATRETWRSVLTQMLRTPPLQQYLTTYARCGTELAAQTLGAELSSMVDTADAQSAQRLAYLMSFDYGAAQSLASMSRVATTAASLTLRDEAIARLVLQTSPNQGLSSIPSDEQPAWRAFFRGLLAKSTSAERFRLVYGGTLALSDQEALPIIGKKLTELPFPGEEQRSLICDAHAMTEELPAAWEAFLQSIGSTSTLAVEAQQVLQTPSSCP